MKSLEEVLKAEVGIVAGAHGTGTVNGSGIDTKNFDEALIVVNSGTNGTSGTVDIKLQESNDDGSSDAYADITGAAFTQITESNDNNIYVARVNVKNFEKWLRVVAVVGTAACDFGVTVSLGKFDGLAPVAQNNAVEFALNYIGAPAQAATQT